jgi:transcriptional regulator with XRE-family HTH domain
MGVGREGVDGMRRDRTERGQDHGHSIGNGGNSQTGTEAWGRELRRLREDRGWTQVELAHEMGYDPSVISKVESGTTTASEQHARAADRAFGLPRSLVSLREILLNLGGGQWQPDVAEMEKRATLISLWDPCYLPGLLQTEAYMREVFLTGRPDAADEQINRYVAERLERQEVWQRADPPPPLLHAVIWEPAFRVPVGGPKVMHGQLIDLARAARANRWVRLQVLPLAHGCHAGMGGSFLVANFPHERPAAVLDNLLTGHMTEKRAEVDRLSLLFSTLASDAISPQASADMIERWAGEWRT